MQRLVERDPSDFFPRGITHLTKRATVWGVFFLGGGALDLFHGLKRPTDLSHALLLRTGQTGACLLKGRRRPLSFLGVRSEGATESAVHSCGLRVSAACRGRPGSLRSPSSVSGILHSLTSFFSPNWPLGLCQRHSPPPLPWPVPTSPSGSNSDAPSCRGLS